MTSMHGRLPSVCCDHTQRGPEWCMQRHGAEGSRPDLTIDNDVSQTLARRPAHTLPSQCIPANLMEALTPPDEGSSAAAAAEAASVPVEPARITHVVAPAATDRDGATHAPGCTVDRVRVSLSAAYNRRMHPGDPDDRRTEEAWEVRKAANPRLFNGSKFRFGGIVSSGAGDADAAPFSLAGKPTPRVLAGDITVRLGLTDYKSYLGTNTAPHAAELVAAGRELGDEAAYLAHPMGVGAMVTTADGHALFIRRSSNVAEAPGMVDVPGGHPEPSAIGLESLPDTPTAAASDGAGAAAGGAAAVGAAAEGEPTELERRAAAELFDSMTEEVVAEVNLPKEALAPPRLLGFLANDSTNGRPSAVFHSECVGVPRGAVHVVDAGHGVCACACAADRFRCRSIVLTLSSATRACGHCDPSSPTTTNTFDQSRTQARCPRHRHCTPQVGPRKTSRRSCCIAAWRN